MARRAPACGLSRKEASQKSIASRPGLPALGSGLWPRLGWRASELWGQPMAKRKSELGTCPGHLARVEALGQGLAHLE